MEKKKQKLNILVLAGGESGERDVSLDSSRAIAETLMKSGHHVRVIDTVDGHYLTKASGNYPDEKKAIDKNNTSDKVITDKFRDRIPTQEIMKIREAGIDVVFNGLHGGSGENGHIQAVLDTLGIPYTGSPMAASAVAMNKDISKRIMRSLSIPTAEWRAFDLSQKQSIDNIAGKISKEFLHLLPLVIKPVDGGSTVGLSLVETADQIVTAVEEASKVSSLVMAEKYVAGREITIAVLNGEALPPVEIKPTHKLYDYTCKYTKGKSEYSCPADIDGDIAKKLAQDALLFYDTIGCRGYARVDFIVSPDGTYVCLELNTLPGMTELSLFPMAARAAGIEFDELLKQLCYLAMEGR